MTKVHFLNIAIDNITLADLLVKISKERALVVTPNVDHLVKLRQDSDFLKIYNIADYVLCDSKVVQYILKFLGRPIKEKISGSDLFPAFYQYNRNNHNTKIFLMGGAEGVAQQAKININKTVKREIVVEALSPSFGFEKNELECRQIIEKINLSGANVLAIGVGAPKQEKWVLKYRHLLPNIKVFLPIGATIDFEAGHTSRAPEWISNIGLEWLYRLLMEPKRLWKRYLVDSLSFFIDLIKVYLNKYTFDPLLRLKSLPLGHLLYDAGLISSEELKLLLDKQKQEKYQIKLGQLAIKFNFISEETVNFFVKELPQIIEQKQRLTIEEYLIRASLIPRTKFNLFKDQASNESHYYERLLFDFIVKENYLSEKTLHWFINLREILEKSK